MTRKEPFIINFLIIIFITISFCFAEDLRNRDEKEIDPSKLLPSTIPGFITLEYPEKMDPPKIGAKAIYGLKFFVDTSMTISIKKVGYIKLDNVNLNDEEFFKNLLESFYPFVPSTSFVRYRKDIHSKSAIVHSGIIKDTFHYNLCLIIEDWALEFDLIAKYGRLTASDLFEIVKSTAAIIIPNIQKEIYTRKLILEGIFWDEDKPIALINGRLVKKGDFIDRKKVIDIQKDKVIIKDDVETMELKIKP